LQGVAYYDDIEMPVEWGKLWKAWESSRTTLLNKIRRYGLS
jgi:hypothetical protein